ncbi:hypothetical protein ABIA32_001746 [Streptacidiphilus sp. MAP12-20]|uniref:outer membrane protein assembly factor BamB family protein n=1 Tax=Streptacidiphilus sp. MAP12-20 TaxID=3156299 RepID=UPI0035112AF1
MTDQSPASGRAPQGAGQDEDDYRLAAGEPQDAVPPSARRAETPVQYSATENAPPPQQSGQPGWSYAPTEAATPQVPPVQMPAQPPPMQEPQYQPEYQPQYPPQGGGYGYPQQQQPYPPAPPTQGYGYPGVQQPPPYQGQQQQMGDGYGYPQPPMVQPPLQQPGYGYPAGPGMPPMAPPPKKGLGAGAIGGIIAGVVVLAGIATVGVVLTNQGGSTAGSGGGGGGGGPRTLAAGWYVPGNGATKHQLGAWLTTQYLIRGTDNGVTAYKVTDGSVAWTAKPLSGPGVPCTMSPTVSATGIGTIGFGPDVDHCSSIVGVDTRSGQTLFSTPLTSKDHTSASSASTFVDGNVGVILNDNVIGGVDLTDGKPVWGYKSRGQYCNEYPYGGASVVLVDDYCADASPTYALTALDAATGKEVWRKAGTDHVEIESVLAGPSPVVARLLSGSTATNTHIYDATGEPRPLNSPNEIVSDGLSSRMLDSSTLLLETRSQTPVYGLTAFNLTTGAVSWSYDGESHKGAILAHSAQDAGGKLYAISLADYGSRPQLVSLDPTTGKSTVLATLPASDSEMMLMNGTVFVLPDPKVLFVSADSSTAEIQTFK